LNWHKTNILAISLSAMAALAGSPASAQSIQSYRCSDGTQFIVGFYEADSRAFMQIDGRAVTLRKRLAASGSRYSGSGVTLKIGKAGIITVKHAKRPVTACDLEERS
jgi:membrane-bound inhibitor of C-type lysozyme